MSQEEINENKSFVAFYFAKFNDDARIALNFDTFTEAFEQASAKLGGPVNVYLRQRRDEFDNYFPWRKGFDREPTDAVKHYYALWNSIPFDEFTQRVKDLLG